MKKIKGSLTIETALVLPIFIFAISSFIFLIKVVYIHEQVQFALSEAANKISLGSYVLEKNGLLSLQQETYTKAKANLNQTLNAVNTVTESINGLTDFKNDISHEVNEIAFESTNNKKNIVARLDAVTKDINAIKQNIETDIVQIYTQISDTIESIQVLAEDSKHVVTSAGVVPGMEVINNVIGSKIVASIVNQYISTEDYENWRIVNGNKGMDYSGSRFCLGDDDITLIVNYSIEIPFLQYLIKPINMTQAVKTRAYLGNGNFHSNNKYSSFTKGESTIVYITKHGTKYHTSRNCRYINVQIKETTYGNVKNEKAICEVCASNKKELMDSTIVFTTDASDIYHTNKSCWTIKREVMPISLEEAKEKGYMICSKCKEEIK